MCVCVCVCVCVCETVMVVTPSVQPESGRIYICRIRLPASFSVPFFQRRHGSYCAKPTRIQSGWRGQDLAKHVWPRSKLVYMNQEARFLAGRNRPATSFTLSDDLPQTSRIILYKTSPDPILVLADCVGFWPDGSGPELSQCARIIWTASGQYFPADPDRIRHVYWEVTYNVTR